MADGEIIDYSQKDGHHYVFGADSKSYSDNYDRIFRKKAKRSKRIEKKRIERKKRNGEHDEEK